jgi:hypothetical protein
MTTAAATIEPLAPQLGPATSGARDADSSRVPGIFFFHLFLIPY